MVNDKYASLAELATELSMGKDYRIVISDRNSWATIVAPHGGFIESGSSRIAACVAGLEFNLFDFQGLREDSPEHLHITSTRFRHAGLTKLMAKSCAAVSIHCMGKMQKEIIWLGGRNRSLKDLAFSELSQASLEVNPDSPKYRGESPANLVNLSCKQGIQLELSRELMDSLFLKNASFFKEQNRLPKLSRQGRIFAEALRNSLFKYQTQERICLCKPSQAG